MLSRFTLTILITSRKTKKRRHCSQHLFDGPCSGVRWSISVTNSDACLGLVSFTYIHLYTLLALQSIMSLSASEALL